MNSNIKLLLEGYGLIRNFAAFINLIEIGVINKDTACDAVIEYKNPEYICEFAANIEGANIQKLEDAIIQIDDVVYIYSFAEKVKGANISRLEDAMCKSKDNNIKKAQSIFRFACNIKDANIDKLCDAICETQDAELIYVFAKEVKGANIQKLEDAIIQAGNINFIKTFAKYIKGANIEKLKQAVEYIKENVEMPEIKRDMKYLLFCLVDEHYDFISKNKQEFAKLFIDDTFLKEDKVTENTLKLNNKF